MAKKALNVKFKKIGFWTFGFIFWYLVIAFFLKSEYPIFNYNFDRSIAFDTFKDSLTLAAAFLAPVAAFVLFNDWRAEHIEKKLENDSETIIKDFNDMLKILIDFYKVIGTGDKKSEERGLNINHRKNEILIKISCNERDINRLNGDEFEINEFRNSASKVIKSFKKCITKMYELDWEYQTSSKNLIPDFHAIDKEIDILNKNIDKLNENTIKLKVRN